MGVLIEKKPNPAKEALRGYRWLLKQRDELEREIEESYERATSCTARVKPVHVSGGNAAYDRMAYAAIHAADARTRLVDKVEEINGKLGEILRLIDLATDQRARLVLTLRYVRGMSWEEIAGDLRLEKRQTFVIHGRALAEINRKM